MKKVLFIAALVTLASCSNETTTTCKDSTCKDSTCKDSTCADSTCVDSVSVDSLAHRVELRADSVLTGIKELKK